MDRRQWEVTEERPVTSRVVSVDNLTAWREGSRHVVDPATLVVAVADKANRGAIAQWDIDHRLNVVAACTA